MLPTGADDTVNLQCAFDNALALGPGVTVRLVEGTYHTRQIVVNNLKGAFIGAGAQKSVLTNLPNLYVNPSSLMSNTPPSASNPWPLLVTFVGGDFLVSDMGMSITGDKPTTGWTVPGLPPPLKFYELLNGFGFTSTRANAIFLRVDIEGELAPNDLSGYNVMNGIEFEADGTGFGPTEKLISGSLVVSDSIFRSVGSAIAVSNVSDSWILITRNTCEDVYDALDLSCLLRSRYEFSFNTVQTTNVYDPTYNCSIYDQDKTISSIASSEILISHNVFTNHSSVPGSISTGIGNRRYVHGRV